MTQPITETPTAEHDERSRIERLRPYQWKKGQSGNPTGKKRPAFMDLVKDADVKTVVANLVQAAIQGKEWAVIEFLNRMYGKAPQKTELSGPNGEPIQIQQAVDEFQRLFARYVASEPETETIPGA